MCKTWSERRERRRKKEWRKICAFLKCAWKQYVLGMRGASWRRVKINWKFARHHQHLWLLSASFWRIFFFLEKNKKKKKSFTFGSSKEPFTPCAKTRERTGIYTHLRCIYIRNAPCLVIIIIIIMSIISNSDEHHFPILLIAPQKKRVKQAGKNMKAHAGARPLICDAISLSLILGGPREKKNMYKYLYMHIYLFHL